MCFGRRARLRNELATDQRNHSWQRRGRMDICCNAIRGFGSLYHNHSAVLPEFLAEDTVFAVETSMNPEEHLYLKLSEECDEVSQRVLKLLQFGPDERQSKNGEPIAPSNAVRLRDELNDLLAVLEMCEEFSLVPANAPGQLEAHKLAKRQKIHEYLLYSIQLGRVQSDVAPYLEVIRPLGPCADGCRFHASPDDKCPACGSLSHCIKLSPRDEKDGVDGLCDHLWHAAL